MKKIFKFKLKTKIISSISVVVFVLITLSTLFGLYNQNKDLHQALTTKAMLIADMAVDGIIPALWNLDITVANGVLKGLLSDQEFAKATVKDETDSIFASVNRAPNKKWQASNLVTIKKSLVYKKQKIGMLEVSFTKSLMTKKIYETMIQEAMINIALIVILVIGLILATGQFTQPLAYLVRIMRKRATGDFDEQIDNKFFSRGDEIGDVATSMRLARYQREDEAAMMALTQALNTETKLSSILNEIIAHTTDILRCERSSLFLYDKEEGVLWSQVAEGLSGGRFTLPVDQGIVGEVFKSTKMLNISDVQAHPLFKGDMKGSGFVTRNMLSAPLFNKDRQVLGVVQCMNSKKNIFNEHDEDRLNSISIQAAIAIENNSLFEETITLKNYQHSILESLTNGVIAFDINLHVQSVNSAGANLLQLTAEELIGKPSSQLFYREGLWVSTSLNKVLEGGIEDITMDAVIETSKNLVSINSTASPLEDYDGNTIGVLLVLEDITTEKRLIGTMSKYMNKEIVEQVLSDSPAGLQGEEQKATVLFSDIRGFTTLSESIGGVKTVALLNDYFEIMVNCLMKHGGILDKYIGDAIMGVFGVPFAKENDAGNAVNTAIEMLQELEQFNANQRKINSPVVSIGIGLNTGSIVAGNIGATKRIEYTVIGDTVNLAARIEALSKTYGAPLLISEFVKSDIEKEHIMREVDFIQVKGRTKPCLIYEVLDYKYTKNPEDANELIERFHNGLSLYREQSWDKALTIFQALKEHYPDDKLSKVFIERCQYLKENSPGDDWDGVWIMTEK